MLKGDRDGIDIAKYIRKELSIPLIFISSHSDQSTLDRAKEVHPNGYLVKPFEEEDVLVAIEMALNNFAFDQQKPRSEPDSSNFILKDNLFIRQNNLAVKVPFDDIEYIEADSNYSIIYSTDRKYVVRSTLKELEETLPLDMFYRTHKSYLVSLSKLKAINADIVVIGEKELPIGRKQRA